VGCLGAVVLRRGPFYPWPACQSSICDLHADHHPSKSSILLLALHVSSIGLILFSILSILSSPLFKLSAPQDLPSRCVSSLHLPLPASYGIFKTFLKTSPLSCWVGSVFGIGFLFGCCRGVRLYLLGGSFCFLVELCFSAMSQLFLAFTGWEC
jgi:hypothetical protein